MTPERTINTAKVARKCSRISYHLSKVVGGLRHLVWCSTCAPIMRVFE